MSNESNSYKLTYFPIKALAEPIRFLLKYGEIEFEDFRLDVAQWPNVKDKMPFGQVPVLEMDGKMVHQSVAISRYLAKLTNLTGNNDLENLEIDAIVDTITDFRSKIAVFNTEKDDTRKEVLKDNLTKETIPYYLTRFDSITAANDGYLAIGRLTWADLYFVSLLDYCNGVLKKDIIAEYSNLVKLREKVLAIPSIKQWLLERPDSEY
ncbi:glutathione S-transferase-like [Onthophagus taurus]|uniref:glutathione S-transferase-like n=1 Tax=Onthophagus taurus TaxID=166361 RepID=UPI000C20AD3B|nr:glutathione S-transferase-like [Onthophagus taurus]